MVGAGEALCFGGLKSTFRDRRKRSEQLDLDVQTLWQTQYFGRGGGLPHGADFVAGAVNRDFWTCGSFSEVVAGRYSVDLEVHIAVRFRGKCNTLLTLKCKLLGRP